MDVLSIKSAMVVSMLAAFPLAVTGCASDGSGEGESSSEAAPAEVMSGEPAEMEDTSSEGDSAADGSSTDPVPAEASDPAAVADVGPAAAPGEGRLQVGGKTYDLTIASCKFNGDGPAEGTFEVKGTDADGHNFEMTQFFLGGDWSQSDVQLDLDKTKIYVISSSAREGAEPATVDGKNVTWVTSFRELDEAANSQVDLGEGTLNLTCG